jgi:hypothetical protein
VSLIISLPIFFIAMVLPYITEHSVFQTPLVRKFNVGMWNVAPLLGALGVVWCTALFMKKNNETEPVCTSAQRCLSFSC